MKLTVVGCTGGLPGPTSPASCYLVESDGFRLVLDLGNGALGPLQALVAGPDIGAIVLSHLHADHCLDMTVLAVLLRYGPSAPARPIPVLAPPGAAERLATASYPGSTPAMFDGLFDFVPAAEAFGPLRIQTAPVNHPVPAVAVRLWDATSSLVFSGDTGVSPALIALARDADALLCEAGWGGSPVTTPDLHLSGAQAGEHAAAAGVGRLLITHVPPWESVAAAVAGAASTFGGPVEAVRPGAVYDLGALAGSAG